MEDAIFEFVAIYGVLCMRFPKTLVNTKVFLTRWSKNTVKYTISNMLSCQRVANSGVFATCAKKCCKNDVNTINTNGPMFWLDFGAPRVRKHRK